MGTTKNVSDADGEKKKWARPGCLSSWNPVVLVDSADDRTLPSDTYLFFKVEIHKYLYHIFLQNIITQNMIIVLFSSLRSNAWGMI